MTPDDVLLQEIKDGTCGTWPRGKVEEVLDGDRIDALRRRVGEDTAPWVSRVVELLGSLNAEQVLIGHCIGRAVINAHTEARAAAAQAISRWGDNPVLRLSLLHDLMEDDAWMARERAEIVRYIEDNPDQVRTALLSTFFKGDEGRLLRFSVGRLADVWSGEPKTMNARSKAFVYVLYLGLVRDPGRQQAAANCIRAHLSKADPFYDLVAARVLERLPEATHLPRPDGPSG